LPNIQIRIQNAFSNYLGIDNAKAMRDATIAVIGVQKNALRDLAEFKIEVSEDFKPDKILLNEILTNLGFTQYHKAAKRKDQEALIQLLYQFKTNMIPSLQTTITAAGTPVALITTIINYADTLKNSNVTQETLKGSRKEVSQAGVTEFNAIYTQVISVAKISAKFYKDDKAIKDEFSYAKTIKNLNQPNSKNNNPHPPPPPPPAE